MKQTITIGIPVYNNARHITELLMSIFEQSNTTHTIEKILIINDASTDDTARLVRAFDDDRITLITHSTREGRAASVNELCERATTDALVLIDPESNLASTSALDALSVALQESVHVKLAGGAAMPYIGTTFIEKAVATQMEYYRSRALQYKNGNNMYTATGRLLAMKRELYHDLRVPNTIYAIERYIYMACITQGFSYRFAPSAYIQYRAAHSVDEYILRTTRTMGTRTALQYHFPSILVYQQYRLPVGSMTFSQQFFAHPIVTLVMTALQVYCIARAFVEKHSTRALMSHELTTKESI